MKEYLNIVDDNDVVIGIKEREEIHRFGLLHREIHVYFVTPNRELILQHRAKDKDTYPDMFDATVGGHVEIGDSYLETAVKETLEETGLKVEADDLILINKLRRRAEDKATGKINDVIGESYLYFFKGNISDLKVEKDKALGFELWPLDSLPDIDAPGSERFIPYVLNFANNELKKAVDSL